METILRFEDRLDGLSNYSIWKEMIALVSEKYEIWEFVAQIQIPPNDATLLAAHNKRNMEARRIILDRVKGHTFLSAATDPM